jgi:hypothetical protein
MSTQPVNIAQEEADLYEACARGPAALFRFFDMFSFVLSDAPMATVHFGKSCEDEEVPKELAKQLRAFCKDQKRAIRENPRDYSVSEGRKKMFWFVNLMIQHGIFLPREQSRIMLFATFIHAETREEDTA